MPAESIIVGEADRLRQLTRSFSNVSGWDQCIRSLLDGKPASFDSVWGSACALLAASILELTGKHVVFVFPTEKQASSFTEDWAVFSIAELQLFPTIDTGHLDDLTTDPRYGQRLKLLKQLVVENRDRSIMIATSIQALSHPLESPNAIAGQAIEIQVGQLLPMQQVQQWLIENAYQQVPAVRIPGEFSVRGGIIDVYAPDWSAPARIEWFDIHVESIRFFDVDSQRSTERCSGLAIAGLPSGKETPVGHLADFMPDKSIVVLFEPQEIESQSKQLISQHSETDPLYSFATVQKSFLRHAVAFAGRLFAESDLAHCRFPSTLVEQFSGDIDSVRREVDSQASGRQLFLLGNSSSEIRRVAEILKTTTVAREDRLHFVTGQIHGGFRLDHLDTIILGSDQLFNRSDVRRRASRKSAKAIDSFIDLQFGDLIVHLAHGIGRFRGLKVLDKDGHRTEHLELEFFGGTRIYLPATKFGLIQKYVGSTKHRPQLAKIGGKNWQRQKQAAMEAVTDLAADMLQMQAKRTARPGIKFAIDTAWQHEFEHSFPYHETPDQLSAIEEIKSDMESPQPMDRLLCGDVGYGKTELAMRAAFKAVENGYQVAILVPTTVLAEQHYRTFRERMAEFPVDIAKLSRFCTPAEQRETLVKLAAGSIDIVIGTHRIASRDVKFRNPGLIIIDEEQKFGVEHKERLKSIRAEVDVLTMSATPIPRTLHMSLVGVRDISNLETPPEDRSAVQTRVTRFDDNLIRDAVLRELERGGQVFFVHNRVVDIQAVADRLQRIVPEARIGIGHGQLPESELELAMTRFINGQFDIFVATTIVENGLDIPNANTIFIDEADRYGLSDLHQLRGRVGRYKHRAFCYLLIDPRKHLNPNAAKRLHAIEKFSDLGAGFSIAMRDLEIRGAGNLLGTEQSGHIASVGYELYCQLLEAAVRSLKRVPAPVNIDVDIDLPIEAYLPDDYINDSKQKIELYRRLSRISNFEDVVALRKEMRDRFGKLPAPVVRLLKLSEIRLEATLWRVSHVFMEEKYLGFRFRDSSRMRQLASATRFNLRIADDSTAWLTLKTERIPPDQLMALLKSVLQAPQVIS